MKWYCFLGLENEDGSSYGSIRYAFEGTREAAVARFSRLFEPCHNGTLGMDYAGDVRGMTPIEAARARITDDPGDSDDAPWGYPLYSDVWNQQLSETLE